MVEAEETRQLKSFQKFKKRLLRAEKILHADKIDYLQRLYSEIHPANNWQERSLIFSVFFRRKWRKMARKLLPRNGGFKFCLNC